MRIAREPALLKTVCCNADGRDLMLPGDDLLPESQWLLSDGWYGAAALLDEHLQSVIRKLLLKSGDARFVKQSLGDLSLRGRIC